MTHSAQSSAEKRNFLLGISRVSADTTIAIWAGAEIKYIEFLDYFLIPLWDNLVDRFRAKMQALRGQVLKAIGSNAPGMGLSKALVTLDLAVDAQALPATTSTSRGSDWTPDARPPWTRPRP